MREYVLKLLERRLPLFQIMVLRQDKPMYHSQKEVKKADTRISYIFVLLAAAWSIILVVVVMASTHGDFSLTHVWPYLLFMMFGLTLIYNSYRSTINKITKKTDGVQHG